MTRARFSAAMCLGITILAATALPLTAQQTQPGNAPINLLNPGSPQPVPADATPPTVPRADASTDTQPVPGGNTAASDTAPSTMSGPSQLSAAPMNSSGDSNAPLPEMQVAPRPGEGKGTLQ